MNKTIRLLLMAAMVTGLGFGMGSCTDKIDNSTGPSDNPQEQQAAEAKAAKAAKYWAIVSHLVDVDDYTDDYENKTFEPVYGVSQGNDGTRYVYTNTPAAAAARFADLVDVKEGIDENTATYTYEDADVGRLVYTKGSGRVLATVDVDIKQIPGLKKIVYVPGAYANGTFTGSAYYRFGDVVSRQVEGYPNGQVTEYWICVRPSFGLEGKGDSHWVCLNVLPKKNVEHYHSDTNGKDYYLPKGLGTNEIHMQNLAEMLFAIYNPEQWQENVSDVANTELDMFNDFDKGKYRLHNQYFWRKVQRLWREKQILQKAFNFSAPEEDFTQMIFGNQSKSNGLHLLYKGYSWYQTFSWNCTLYEAIYINGVLDWQQNMHLVFNQELTQNMREIDLDCRKMGQNNAPNYAGFFNDDGVYRWTVRHATGKELAANGRYDVKSAIDGVTEVYRYYRDADPMVNLGDGPEETPAPGVVIRNQVEVGHILGESGHFYRNCADATDNFDTPAAMVVYLGGNKRVEKEADLNGLAIALSDATDDGTDRFPFSIEAEKNLPCVTNAADDAHIAGRLDGWYMKNKLAFEYTSHPAAAAVPTLTHIEGCSMWFIPSAGQWDLAMQGMGFGTLTNTGEKVNGAYKWRYPQQGRWLFEDAGAPEATLKETVYMTLTARTRKQYDATTLNQVDDSIIGFSYRNNYTDISFGSFSKTLPLAVRPFVAFQIGDGAQENPSQPWAALAEPKAKCWMGEDGKFYNTAYDAFTATSYLPVAYVAYVGAPNSIQVNGKAYRGLAIGTSRQDFDGLGWVEQAGKAGQYVTRLSANVRQEEGFSEWFAPSKAQWKMVLEQGFDCQFNGDTVTEDAKGSKQSAIFHIFEDNGVRSSAVSGPYWTTTAADDEKAYYLDLIDGHTVKFGTIEKTATQVDGKKMLMRSMIAF